MNVVIDARESGTSTGRYIDKLVENLALLESGDDFTVLTKKHRVRYVKKVAPAFEVVESSFKEFSFSEQFRYIWQLYGIKNDLVHFGMTQQPILYFGRSITTIHDLTTARFRNPAKNAVVFKVKQLVYKIVIKIVARKSAAIIVPSEFVKKDLLEFTNIDPDRIYVTYEAADKITDKAEPLRNLVGEKFIMYVGRPQPHKNLARLIDAFELLKQEHPELKLVLAGKKDVLYERQEKRIRQKRIEGVVFTDFVSEGQLRWLYENARAYVFPSLSEGFGLPGLEAMMHGAPVVSSNATCLPEIYGKAALYCNPTDVGTIAAQINEVLTNPSLRKKLIDAGHNQAAKYSWKKTAQQTADIYKSLINT